MLKDSFHELPYRLFHKTSIHSLSTGTGPIILFLHGWIASGRQWEPIISDIPDDYRCIAVDLPGFGSSPALPREQINLETYTDILEVFIESVTEEDRLHAVVGDSLGGILALKLLKRGCLGEARLFLTGCPAGGLRGFYRLSRLPGLVTLYMKVLQKLPRAIAQPFIKAGSFVTLKYPKYVDNQILADIYSSHPLTSELTARELSNSIIDEIETPPDGNKCLVIRGHGDVFAKEKTSKELALKLGGEYIEIKDAKHNPKIDSKAEFVNLLSEFLK